MKTAARAPRSFSFLGCSGPRLSLVKAPEGVDRSSETCLFHRWVTVQAVNMLSNYNMWQRTSAGKPKTP